MNKKSAEKVVKIRGNHNEMVSVSTGSLTGKNSTSFRGFAELQGNSNNGGPPTPARRLSRPLAVTFYGPSYNGDSGGPGTPLRTNTKLADILRCIVPQRRYWWEKLVCVHSSKCLTYESHFKHKIQNVLLINL